MLGWILLAIGVLGFGYCGYRDLKTTEFQDWIPYAMIRRRLGMRAVFAYISGDITIITTSVFYGLLLLGFGYLLYFLKQWGDGDAWLMGAMGFLFPESAGFVPVAAGLMPFPLVLVFNLFLISLVYVIAYALVLGVKTPRIYRTFMKNLRARKRSITYLTAAVALASISVPAYMTISYQIPLASFYALFTMPFMALGIMLFLQYARAVESDLFKRKIKAKDLRPGDVIISDKFRGLTEEEVKKLQKRGGEVWIKEGVRLAPVFVITLLVSLFLGSLFDLMFLI